jgi:hypothetical protein
MLHDGGKRDREGPGELADREILLFAEPGEKRPPCRIGERGKGAVEARVMMLNHIVKRKAVAILLSSA